MIDSRRTRPGWDEYFLEVLNAVARRATCDRGRSGAVIAYQQQIIATGYVGSPPGFPHCDDVGHELVDGRCVRTVHAEQNALASAARRGIAVLDGTLYSTMVPCRTCAMLIITAGIERVVAAHTYPGGTSGFDILRSRMIEVVIVNPLPPTYES